ncbi:MAG: hypothetical protein KF768_04310 [Phycisphaeraceae bacterium]|nr:hypothetical protein [Phycisphaeraceae bacterium]
MLRPAVFVVLAAGIPFSVQSVAMGSSDDVRAIVAEMMADAETRSSLLAGGDAGHDGKFFVAGDGFKLNVGGGTQFRYIMNFRDDENTGDDLSNGFQMARARIQMSGTVHERWAYMVLGQFSTTDDADGSFRLLDGYVGYTFDNGWGLYFGQVKAPIVREDMTSDFHLFAVERSASTDFMRPDRVKGVWVHKQEESWRTWITFNSGADTDNTDFNAMSNADYAFSARFEFLFDGQWSQFADFTSPKGSDFGAMLGLAAHYQGPHNTGNPADVDTSVFLYTADVGLEGDGWNLFAGFIGRYIDQDSFMGDAEFNDFSFVVQGGLMLSERWEVFARYDALILDDDRGLDNDYFGFVTVGVNHYFAGHAAKFTADIVYSTDETLPDLTAVGGFSTKQGLQGDVSDGEVAIRLQMQLMF